MSRVLLGSGSDGSWTQSDWDFYLYNRSDILYDPQVWKNPDPAGLEGFAIHIRRLSAYYDPNDKNAFLRDLSLLYGGVSSTEPWSIASIKSFGGGEVKTTLHEGMQGWASSFYDDDGIQDQTHHYIGVFFVSFRLSNVAGPGMILNQIRDFNNKGDQILDVRAAHDAVNFQSNNVTVQDFYKYVLALSISPNN